MKFSYFLTHIAAKTDKYVKI